MTDKQDDIKCTPERRAAILDAISHQIPYVLAAAANGVAYDELMEWFQRGHQDERHNIDSEYSQFVIQMSKAEMQCIRSHLDFIAARPEHWQAHAWLLERRWPEYYGKCKNEKEQT